MSRYIPCLLLCVCIAGCNSNDQPAAKPVVSVSVQRVTTADVPLIVTAPAEVHGKSEAQITSRITATVQRLLVHKGEKVSKGQILVVLDQGDLAAQRAAANANVANAEASLQRTKNASIPAQVMQAKSDFDAKKAALDLATKVYGKRKGLLAQGAISERELETSSAALAQAQANYDTAKTNLIVIQKHASANDLQMAQSTLAQSRAGAALANANLGFSELRSPSNGSVTEQNIFPGDLANPSMSLLTITDMSSAVARAQVAEQDAASVRVGQTCSFKLSDSDQTASFGRVTVVNQALDTARRTVEVWCEIPNKDARLKAGEFGAVQIAVGMAPNAIVLPASAVEFKEGTQNAKLFTVDASHIAHLREVSAVVLSDKRVRITSGIAPGELVITDGEYGIPDGTEVTVGGGTR